MTTLPSEEPKAAEDGWDTPVFDDVVAEQGDPRLA